MPDCSCAVVSAEPRARQASCSVVPAMGAGAPLPVSGAAALLVVLGTATALGCMAGCSLLSAAGARGGCAAVLIRIVGMAVVVTLRSHARPESSLTALAQLR